MNEKYVAEKIVIREDYEHKDFIKQVNLDSWVGDWVTTTTSRVDPGHRFEFTKEMLEEGGWGIKDVGSYDEEYRLCFTFCRPPSEKELEYVKSIRSKVEESERRQYEELKKKFG